LFTDIHIETNRLTIRPLVSEDADQFYDIVQQDEVMRYLPEDTMSLTEVKKIIDWLGKCYWENKPSRIIKFTVAIVWKKTGEVIGWVGLGPLDFNPSEVEIYYGLTTAYWGRGIATEAARAMLKYGFETIGIKRIVAVTRPENVGSVKVLEKLKMRFEEKPTGLPDEHQHYEGSLLYSISKSEALEIF